MQDWRKRNVRTFAYGVIKISVLCRYISGEFEQNIETTEIGFFDKDHIPDNLAPEKSTIEQIEMCFEAHEKPDFPVQFD